MGWKPVVEVRIVSGHASGVPQRLGLIPHPARSGILVLRHALSGLSARSSGLTGFRRVLRCALGLQLLGVENAVAPETAIRQSLRVVFKSVRRGFGSRI